MSFGEVLKEIRIKNGDSLRRLGEKADIFFTRIDKIEKNINNVNKEILEKLLEAYPNLNDKKRLLMAYVNDLLPKNTENLLFNDINEVDNFYLNFLKALSIEERKNIYNSVLEKIEFFSLKNGNYKKKKSEIEKVKNIINNLK